MSLIIRTAADLKQIRTERGITAQELADRLGVSRQLLFRWESGKENITLATIEKICQVVGVRAIIQFDENV